MTVIEGWSPHLRQYIIPMASSTNRSPCVCTAAGSDQTIGTFIMPDLHGGVVVSAYLKFRSTWIFNTHAGTNAVNGDLVIRLWDGVQTLDAGITLDNEFTRALQDTAPQVCSYQADVLSDLMTLGGIQPCIVGGGSYALIVAAAKSDFDTLVISGITAELVLLVL